VAGRRGRCLFCPPPPPYPGLHQTGPSLRRQECRLACARCEKDGRLAAIALSLRNAFSPAAASSSRPSPLLARLSGRLSAVRCFSPGCEYPPT
jgi:hypothetical protein